MSDLFAPLRRVEPVPAPPAEEVRRRGDRIRRRRAARRVAGAACAVAVVMAGASLVGRDSASSDSAPGPVDSSVEAVIPAELGLADDLPRDFTRPVEGPPVVKSCGEQVSLEGHQDAQRGVRFEDGGDFDARGLVVYRDAGAAESAAADVVARLDRCPRFTDARGHRWTTRVRPTDQGDQGWVVMRSEYAPGTGDLDEAIVILRLDRNVLVVHKREIHGARPEDMVRGTRAIVDRLLTRQLCLLTDEGCAWRSDPDVLRPDGWGRLRLGMSRTEVEATGVMRLSDSDGCTEVELAAGTGRLSEAGKLVRLDVPTWVATPEGIGPGSSRDEVEEALWFVAMDRGRVVRAQASPTTDYEITFDGDRVTGLGLRTVGEECAG